MEYLKYTLITDAELAAEVDSCSDRTAIKHPDKDEWLVTGLHKGKHITELEAREWMRKINQENH